MIYISGPITNKDPMVQRANLHAFDVAAEALNKAGYNAFNPAALSHLNMTYAEYMRADIEALLKCDGMAQLPGWSRSRGALIEHDIARVLEMDIRKVADFTPEVKS